MPKKTVVADAWDDDWETQAGAAVREEEQQPTASEQEAPLTKAERLAQHAESNRKLWESAYVAKASLQFVSQGLGNFV